jgi:hypothetical protein
MPRYKVPYTVELSGWLVVEAADRAAVVKALEAPKRVEDLVEEGARDALVVDLVTTGDYRRSCVLPALIEDLGEWEATRMAPWPHLVVDDRGDVSRLK